MLIEILLATIIGIVMLGFRWYTGSIPTITPDFVTYNAMTNGKTAPDPFRLRWLLPKLMRPDSPKVWGGISVIGLLLSFPALYWFVETLGASGLWAVMLWGSLPVIDILWRMRGMIDHVAWPVALVTATVLLHGWIVPGVILVIICGMLDPRLPVFVAAWTLNPWALIGLIPVAVAYMVTKKGTPYIHAEIINHPWSSAKRLNGQKFKDMKTVLFPWGACVAGLVALNPAVIISLILGYAQMFRAIDRIRLYMWAAPVLIVATLGVIPEAWLPLAVIVTLLSPWRSET